MAHGHSELETLSLTVAAGALLYTELCTNLWQSLRENQSVKRVLLCCSETRNAGERFKIYILSVCEGTEGLPFGFSQKVGQKSCGNLATGNLCQECASRSVKSQHKDVPVCAIFCENTLPSSQRRFVVPSHRKFGCPFRIRETQIPMFNFV